MSLRFLILGKKWRIYLKISIKFQSKKALAFCIKISSEISIYKNKKTIKELTFHRKKFQII